MVEKKITAKNIKDNFRRAYDYKRAWIKEAHEDFRFSLGKMWEEKDAQELKDKGILPLTINKIRPNIKLLCGIESQNRSDILCYPEGEESSIKAEIATLLVKNVVKTSGLNYKRSEQFRYGIICGECYLEPYIDYTYDMVNGDMRFKKIPFNAIYPEPSFEEYDLSDARYVIKCSFNLTEDQILSLYPDKKKYIEEIGANGTFTDTTFPELKDELGLDLQRKNYNDSTISTATENGSGILPEEKRYDLIEQYFKKWIKRYYVVLFQYGKDGQIELGNLKEAKDKAEAEFFLQQASVGMPEGKEPGKIIERVVPEIWRAAVVGNSEELIEEEGRAPTYPNWPSYPVIPFFADRYTVPMKYNDTQYLVQGIVRDMKSLNVEFNKRRTQELRILNSSANSGWMMEEGSVTDEAAYEKYGASPGVILKHKAGRAAPQRIEPAQLSQGHAQLAAEGGQDMREASGINAEQLTLDSGEKSGRAIALRQKQGLVMVQQYFDNLSQTTRLLGKFILANLGEVFDVGEAMRVLGESFIHENFSEPVLVDGVNPMTGAPEKKPQLGPDGKLVMQVNQQLAVQTVNQVITDASLGRYEIAVGETISNETMKYANYLVLMDMAEKGLPIPPEVLIDESMLSNGSKEKIKSAIQAQQAAMAKAVPAPVPGKAG